MYLSRLTFDLREPVAVRALSDLHAMHRLILQAFPDQEEGGMGRVLYRVEVPRTPRDLPVALVQSEVRPDWELLARLACADGPKEWEPSFAEGSVYRFRLQAAPTVKRRFGPESERPGHRRIGLYTEDEQRAWLERKGREGGFAVQALQITPLGKLGGRSPRDGTLTFTGVEYDGLLRVLDPAQFTQSVKGGIGSAKGFGFGLLSLSRP